MSDSIELVSNLYDLLSRTFSIDGGNSYLQMGWPGIALSPADFKPFGAQEGGYDAQAAEETFSYLANIVPTGSALRFENSGFEIDDVYQILLYGAIPGGADPDNLTVNPMYKLFSDAQYDYLRQQKGSNRDPNIFYQPCRATPSDWYTEASAAFWPTISLSATQLSQPTENSPFIRKGGSKLVAEQGIWKLAPPKVDAVKLDKDVQAALAVRAAAAQAKLKPTTGGVVTKPALIAKASAIQRAAPSIARGRPAVTMNDHAFAATFAALNATPAAKKNLRPVPVFNQIKALPQLTIDAPGLTLIPPKKATFNQQLAIRDILASQCIKKPVSTDTKGFSISFKFCRVNIDRGSWYKNALLNTLKWYMYNTKAGEYAKGAVEGEAAIFPVLPDSFIAIRDLTMRADWSPQDVENLKQAKAFGPFDISSANVIQNTIEAKGLQIIAWTSRLNPALPPMSDPSI